ncbi:CLUMA_CG015564, isoform A [Clunio marinus]|uniref:CLUMA_CG015564, isoform A n=1 Tax=Clunio marinus TaxID=568069 RepID=A0A1J1IR05_9DIPT|nr:CLUMA_CG015564, isoform A [Clunio marinus]
MKTSVGYNVLIYNKDFFTLLLKALKYCSHCLYNAHEYGSLTYFSRISHNAVFDTAWHRFVLDM